MSAVLKPRTNPETLTASMVDEFTELHSQVKDIASQHSEGTRRLKDAGRISSVLFNSLSNALYLVK
jgi:hypothetical protein